MSPGGILHLVLLLLAAAVVLSVVADKLALPPAIPLVVGGILLALIPGLPTPDLDPSLILVLFLPPLLFYSGYFTVWADFRAELRPIILLSLGAVIYTTAGVGLIAHWISPSLPWAACFALGAVVSPPDAVSARAVFQRVSIPRRIQTILEGESLLNDASGLVLYRFAVAATLTGAFRATEATMTFVWVVLGGIGAGLVVGIFVAYLLRQLSESRYIVVTTLLGAYGSYIGAEEIGASGVLAVVACGLLVGWRQHDVLSAEARRESHSAWELIVFILETLVFILIGLSLHGILDRMGGRNTIWHQTVPLAAASIMTVIVARITWIFLASFVRRTLRRHATTADPLLSIPVLTLMSWSGMRGVVSLAAALALPKQFPGRDLILFSTFAVILATVFIQGLTLGPLVKWLHLPEAESHPDAKHTLTSAETRVQVNKAAVQALEAVAESSQGTDAHRTLLQEYRRRLEATERLRDDDTTIGAESHAHFDAALAATQESRVELLRLLHAGDIHESVAHELEAELDLEEIRWGKLAESISTSEEAEEETTTIESLDTLHEPPHNPPSKT